MLPQELSLSCDGEFDVGVRGGADDVDDGIGDGFGGSLTPHRNSGAVGTVNCWRRCAELSRPWLVDGVVGGAPLFFFSLPLPSCYCCVVVVVAPTVADDGWKTTTMMTTIMLLLLFCCCCCCLRQFAAVVVGRRFVALCQ